MPITLTTALSVSLTGSFSIEKSQSGGIMPGEAIGIRVTPESEAGTAFSGLDPYRDVLWVIDTDDDLGEFTVSGGPYGNGTARTAMVRNLTKAWMTPGTKTVTVTAYQGGMTKIAEGTTTVDVLDPDTYSWDLEIYHDPSGTFSGMPADNGTTIRRTQTHANARTWNGMWTAGDDVRIVMADGQDMDLDESSGSISLSNGNGLVYIQNESLGASGIPVWTDTTTSTSTVFTDGSSAATRTARIAVVGLDVQLNFDPTDGSGNQRILFSSAWIDEAGAHDNHISFARVIAKGFSNGVSTGGNNAGTSTADAFRFFYDCDWGNHFDYCHFHGTGRLWAGMNGCTMLPHPNTICGDTKASGTYMPNHALATRWQNAFAASTVNCYTGGGAGWTGQAPDYVMQHCQRLVPHNTGGEAPEYIFSQVKSVGRFMLNIVDANSQDLVEPIATVIDMCLHVGTRQSRHMAEFGVGGVYIRNCIMWIPEVATAAQPSIGYGIAKFGDDNNPPAGTQKQSYVEYCTVVSDRDSDGGTEAWDTIVDAGWTGETINTGNLVIEVPGHTNAGSFPSQGTLSRADLFKPLTASTSIVDAVTTGYRPVNDFNGNTRNADGSGDTNIGAHDTDVASDAGVTAPANTVAPSAPTAVAGHTDDFIFDHGTWTGIDDNAHLGPIGKMLWNQKWFVGGVEDGEQGTRYARALYGGSGSSLTASVAYVGLGGQAPSYVTSSGSITI